MKPVEGGVLGARKAVSRRMAVSNAAERQRDEDRSGSARCRGHDDAGESDFSAGVGWKPDWTELETEGREEVTTECTSSLEKSDEGGEKWSWRWRQKQGQRRGFERKREAGWGRRLAPCPPQPEGLLPSLYVCGLSQGFAPSPTETSYSLLHPVPSAILIALDVLR